MRRASCCEDEQAGILLGEAGGQQISRAELIRADPVVQCIGVRRCVSSFPAALAKFRASSLVVLEKGFVS